METDESRRERSDLARLVERHERAVRAVVLAITGDPYLCDEVAQEVFVVAWRKQEQLRDQSRQKEWLCGIARNLARRRLRDARRRDALARRAHDPLDTLAAEEGGLDPTEAAARKEAELMGLEEALASLPTRHREPLFLFYLEGKSVRGLAEQLGLSEDAAKKRLSRARQHLRNDAERTIASAISRLRPTAALVAAIYSAVDAETAAAGTKPALASSGRGSALPAWQGIARRAAFALSMALLGLAGFGMTRLPSCEDRDPRSIASRPATGLTPNSVESDERLPKLVRSVINEPTLSLHLTLVDKDGGPVPHARVTLAAVWGAISDVPLPVATEPSDPQGQSRLSVRRGTYLLTVSATGYISFSAQVSLTHDLHQKIALWPAARLDGIVSLDGPRKDRAGGNTQLGGLRVELVGDKGPAQGRHSARTDDDGRFSIDGLMAGRYTALVVGHAGVAEQEVFVRAFPEITQLAISLHQGIPARGSVEGSDARPLAGACIIIFGGPECVARTSALGTFVLPHVEPGRTLDVRIEAEGFVAQTAALMIGLDGRLPPVRLARAHVIRGIVVDEAGKAVKGAAVELRYRSAGVRSAFAKSDEPERYAETDSNGRFVLTNLAEGDVTLTARLETNLLGRVDVPVEPVQKSEAKIVLAQAGFIEGVVRYDDGSPAGHVAVIEYWNRSDVTDDEGRYRLGPFAPGRYDLRLHAPKHRQPHVLWFAEPDVGKVVEVEKGKRTSLDLTILRHNHTLEGVVVDPSGRPVGGAVVTAGPARLRQPQRWRHGNAWTVTDDEGTFRCESLESGPHTLWVEHGTEGRAELVNVEQDARGLRVVLVRPAKITGRVEGPVPATCEVQIHRVTPEGIDLMPLQEAARIRAGTFVFSELSAGRYDLISKCPGVYAHERLTLAEGEQRSVALALAPAPQRELTVLRAENDQPFTKLVVPFFVNIPGVGRMKQRLETDEAGRLLFPGAPAGARIEVGLWALSYVPKALAVEIPDDLTPSHLGVVRLAPEPASSLP